MATKLDVKEATFDFNGRKYRVFFERYPVYKRTENGEERKLAKYKTVISVREVIGDEDAVLAVGFYDENTARCKGMTYWRGNVHTHGRIITRAASLKKKAKRCAHKFADDERVCCDGTKANMCELCRLVDVMEQKSKEEERARLDSGRSQRT